jgi:hypothetical protein
MLVSETCTALKPLTVKTEATRAHEVHPLQRTYFMTDVAEDTTQLQNAVRSFLSAMEPEESVMTFVTTDAFCALVWPLCNKI